ncbi:MAG: hypothetical protein WAX69_08750 [Victivallales bacterium]
MATNEVGEKIYFSDAAIKVTNVRVSCNHITVPVEKVESVTVNSRIEAFVVGVSIFLLCFSPFLFFHFMPPGVRIPIAVISAILIAASGVWVYLIYKSYVELVVSVGNRSVVMFSVNMAGRDYLCRIASAIGDAISDEKKYQKMKDSGELPASVEKYNPSDTLRFKMILDDYEKLKKAKDEFDMMKIVEVKGKDAASKPNS